MQIAARRRHVGVTERGLHFGKGGTAVERVREQKTVRWYRGDNGELVLQQRGEGGWFTVEVISERSA